MFDGHSALYHLALASDWEAAQRAGSYEVSTRGRTLAQEGFIHLSLSHQLARVAESFYADVGEPMVRLTVDPALLAGPVRLEPGDPADEASERYPHLYGPLPVDAVVAVTSAGVEGGRFVVDGERPT